MNAVHQNLFYFIDDSILRQNLERVSSHITTLSLLIFSDEYSSAERSSFRKTIIIHTASQIEALLLWYLKQHKTEEECAGVERTFRIDQHIYQLSENERIVRGSDIMKQQKFKFQNVNLAQLVHLCGHFELLSDTMAERVQEVRKLRNRQHLGGLATVDHAYSAEDLAFVWEVSEEVLEYVKKQSNA
ncbi:MAG: hypothetical protein BRC23_02585 [Parcubacteria group bacterium SW_4_49_11]|nr:MAG: hypothetical protein BRC23_02585 [Parcubacteria group bacterium SW_4_49_11]